MSFQAVSKWECGDGYPDIVMLPSIAQIFGVSLDELVGMQKICSNEDAEKILAQVDKNESRGLSAENVMLLREAVKRFPNNYMMLAKLASNLFSDYTEGWEGHKKKSAESAEIAEYILANCNDRKVTDWMSVDICHYYYWAGNKEKAIECADNLSDVCISKDLVKEVLLDGEERITLCQKNIMFYVQMICNSLLMRADVRAVDDPQLTYDERIRILHKIIELFDIIFENGDYNFYYRYASMIYSRIADVAINSKNYDLVFDNLEKALEYALLADALPEKKPYTSLSVNKLVYDINDVSFCSPESECEELLSDLNWSGYDDIRDTERFQKIYLKVKEHCDK